MRFLRCLPFCLQLGLVSLPVPNSPCPDIFEYTTDSKSGAIVGTISLGGYRQNFNNTLQVELSLPVFPLSFQNRWGSIELLNIRDLPQKKAHLIVHFPPAVHVPNVVWIKFNGQTICSGPPAKGLKISTIRLYHYVVLGQSYGYNEFTTSQNDHSSEYIRPTFNPTTENNFDTDEIENRYTASNGGCGVPARFGTPLIFQGSVAQRNDWPWLAVLHYKNHELRHLEYRCGATLISYQSLLSAGHCLLEADGLTPLESKELLVSLGRYNVMDWAEPNSKSYNPRSVLVHPGFNSSNYANDIGLIVLANRLEHSVYIRPICLWSETVDESAIVGQLGTVVGWGYTDKGVLSDLPRVVEVPIVSEVECIRADIGLQLTTSNRTLCAGGQGKGPCHGDSGSGLYLWRGGRWVLRGIVSHALTNPDTGKCDTHKYSVYTDVAKYSDWLQEQNFL